MDECTWCGEEITGRAEFVGGLPMCCNCQLHYFNTITEEFWQECETMVNDREDSMMVF